MNRFKPITVTIENEAERELLIALFFSADHVGDDHVVSFENDEDGLNKLAAKFGIKRQWS